MTITVYGMPAPQGSKRYVGTSKAGRGILIESSAKVRPWRQDVKAAALELVVGSGLGALTSVNEYGRMDGPLNVHMIFTLPKPKSAPKRTRSWPDRKPDLSKLVRSTEDALTDAGVWEDDARVVRLVATKCYPGEGTDALHIPGCVIHISEVKD
jgi:Holliday junction resolvase RusA-like endonuclease